MHTDPFERVEEFGKRAIGTWLVQRGKERIGDRTGGPIWSENGLTRDESARVLLSRSEHRRQPAEGSKVDGFELPQIDEHHPVAQQRRWLQSQGSFDHVDI